MSDKLICLDEEENDISFLSSSLKDNHLGTISPFTRLVVFATHSPRGQERAAPCLRVKNFEAPLPSALWKNEENDQKWESSIGNCKWPSQERLICPPVPIFPARSCSKRSIYSLFAELSFNFPCDRTLNSLGA